MPGETEARRRDGWIRTGDVMTRDGAGWFYFVDRAKDAMRRRGENVSSVEVEAAFALHPDIVDCAAYPVPSDLSEDEIMLAAVCKPGRRVDPLDLVKFAEDKLPYFAMPRFIRLMDELPRTATQKVQKAQLRSEGVVADAWDLNKSGHVVSR